MKHPRDLTGMKFGRLKVLEKTKKPDYYKINTSFWLCICDCGNETRVDRNNLLRSNTTSCGCLNKEIVSVKAKETKHNMAKTRFYRIWANMKYRCNNKRCHAYINYGGRGIGYDDRWENFENFKQDMYQKYNEHAEIYGEAQTTLDRINENGNYEPSNCRWATKEEQAKQNKRTNIIVTVCGIKYHSLAELSRVFGIPDHTIRKRYQGGQRDEKLVKK